MNIMTLQNLVVPTFKTCSKNYDYFNRLSINQTFKRTNLGPTKIESIK